MKALFKALFIKNKFWDILHVLTLSSYFWISFALNISNNTGSNEQELFQALQVKLSFTTGKFPKKYPPKRNGATNETPQLHCY